MIANVNGMLAVSFPRLLADIRNPQRHIYSLSNGEMRGRVMGEKFSAPFERRRFNVHLCFGGRAFSVGKPFIAVKQIQAQGILAWRNGCMNYNMVECCIFAREN